MRGIFKAEATRPRRIDLKKHGKCEMIRSGEAVWRERGTRSVSGPAVRAGARG